MWWFAALHANLLMLYRRRAPTRRRHGRCSTPAAAPAGCWRGSPRACPSGRASGSTPTAIACARAAAKSARPVCAGSVNALPFADARLRRDLQRRRAVPPRRRRAPRRWRSSTAASATGGMLILNLPAYRWMMSRHDAAVYNVRRYTRRGVARLLRAAGFRPLFASYWNTMLFPLMVLTRKLLPARRGADSDVELYPRAGRGAVPRRDRRRARAAAARVCACRSAARCSRSPPKRERHA